MSNSTTLDDPLPGSAAVDVAAEILERLERLERGLDLLLQSRLER